MSPPNPEGCTWPLFTQKCATCELLGKAVQESASEEKGLSACLYVETDWQVVGPQKRVFKKIAVAESMYLFVYQEISRQC